MQVDYIIIGQGITGSFLSYYFIKAGKSVLVIDDNKPDSASRVASGIINPVTGRRVVETWMIDTLLPNAQSAYEDMSEYLGVELVDETSIINFHTTEQMLNAWADRYSNGSDYIEPLKGIQELEKYFHVGFGAHIVSPSLLIDLKALLKAWRLYLAEKNFLLEDRFDIDALFINSNNVSYKDVTAQKIFFCNGVDAFECDFFRRLPFSYNKGEAVIIEANDLPRTNIYKQSLSIVPYGNNEFWVGSSFEWDFENDEPSSVFKQKVVNTLDNWLKVPYKILDHMASIRPASLERRPFVGLHPRYNNIGILNGMGTKGCSLAPYFAKQLVDHVLHKVPIIPQAGLDRFAKLLST